MKTLSIISASVAFALAACNAPSPKSDYCSTVVNTNGTVTFNYRNDSARTVQVDVQFAGRHDMTLDTLTGLWTATLGPAEPDMYPYCFIVNGVSIMDPQCDQWFPNEGFKNSLLEITNPGLPHSINDVPHGNVDYITYYSQSLGIYNHALVYTPASYSQSSAALPVFYLISGTTDTEEVYYKVGRVNYILDNLIAQGEAKDMIVVLPYGNPVKLLPGTPDFRTLGDVFSNDLTNDLIPYIESHYRTINDRDHRAIGGFSRGGNQALANGLHNIDKFSYLCSYSSFTTTNIPDVYDNADDTNSKLHLFWLGIGTDDFLYGTSRDYLEFLDTKGIRTVKEFTTGKFGHTWMNAKYFLDRTLRLLFNPEASEVAMSHPTPAPAKTGKEEPFTPGVMARLFPRPIISPEFSEGSTTFRLKAPEAQTVKLEVDALSAPVAMQRDSDGVWNVTVSSLSPDVFCYNFVVDGFKVTDPSNMYLATDKGFKRSVAFVPGFAYNENSVSNIAYSPMTYMHDSTIGRYAVCVPAGHDAKDLPIMNLVAGQNDTYESWFKIAQANVIMDQLIADKKCPKPYVLYLTEKPIKADVVLFADDYATWSARREALAHALTK